MDNFLLKNENAIYYECNYSCDNVIFIKLGRESFFITDARYTVEAREEVKNATVIECSNLIEEARILLKKSKIKKIIFDGNDFTFNAYNLLTKDLKLKFVNKPSFSQQKRIIKSDDEIKFKSLIDTGFTLVATAGTAKAIEAAGIPVERINKVIEGRPHIVDAIKNGDIDLIVNTTEGRRAIADSAQIRQSALQKKLAYSTTLAGGDAVIRAIRYGAEKTVRRLQDLH